MFSGFLSNLKMKVCTCLGLLGDMSTEEKLHLYAILPFQVSSFENASKTQFDIKMSSSVCFNVTLITEKVYNDTCSEHPKARAGHDTPAWLCIPAKFWPLSHFVAEISTRRNDFWTIIWIFHLGLGSLSQLVQFKNS